MDLNRLSHNASAIINMFKHVFNTPQGLDLQTALLYAAGLAGYACHQAVRTKQGRFVIAEMKNGKKYYMGDDLNHYLLEGQYSVLNFCNGYFDHFAKGTRPDALASVKKAVTVLGDPDYRIWDRYPPAEVYAQVKNCWDGIYDNMTAVYCESPEEWPVLFAIVLQNIMVLGTQTVPADTLYTMALECALFLSKMDTESL